MEKGEAKKGKLGEKTNTEEREIEKDNKRVKYTQKRGKKAKSCLRNRY